MLYSNTDNSLLSKYNELSARISIENPDIVSLTEIKPKNGDIPCKEALMINGYELFLNKCYEDTDTRGVCIYVKTELNATPLYNEVTDKFKDSIWVNIKDKHNRNLIIGNIYRSGSPEKAKALDNDLH